MRGDAHVLRERARREPEPERALRRAVRAEPAPAALAGAAREGGEGAHAFAGAEAVRGFSTISPQNSWPMIEPGREQPALVHVEVASADPAREDAQDDLARGGDRIGHALDGEAARGSDDDGPHPVLPGRAYRIPRRAVHSPPHARRPR